MEHIRITISKKANFTTLKRLDFTPMFEYWYGAMKFIPKVLESLPNGLYENNKCLTWYERQVAKNRKKMIELKNTFRWLKK